MPHYLETIGISETAKRIGLSVDRVQSSRHHFAPSQTEGAAAHRFSPEVRYSRWRFRPSGAGLGLRATIKTDSQPGIAELVEVEAPGSNFFSGTPTTFKG
jgi:hypothetical protein